jgi:hypothetical protein
MDRIPETKTESTLSTINNTYYVKERRTAGNASLVDWVLTAVLIMTMFFISASYFVKFGGGLKLSIHKAATDTAWVTIAVLFVKELAKNIFKRKGQRTIDYAKAEKKANKAIQTLNENVDSKKVQEYCEDVTTKTIERYRKHQLTTVGLTCEDFKKKYLGVGLVKMLKSLFKGELSFLQVRAIWRCNHVKTKPYNPAFITAFDAEDNSELVPSQQNDTRKADRRNSIKSFIFAFGSAFGVGFVFSDIFLDFSKEMIFLAIIKIILLIVSFALSATFGWNLSFMEIARNNSRASEAKKCMRYAGVEKDIIDRADKIEEETKEEDGQ